MTDIANIQIFIYKLNNTYCQCPVAFTDVLPSYHRCNDSFSAIHALDELHELRVVSKEFKAIRTFEDNSCTNTMGFCHLLKQYLVNRNTSFGNNDI